MGRWVALLLVWPGLAAAEPYRLRADALSWANAPAGLLLVEGQAQPRSWLGAEAVVWGGTGDEPADALVALVRARDPGGRGEIDLGRMVLATGAVRPVHMDGMLVRGQLPFGPRLEVFGGAPVVPSLADRRYDWLLGARGAFVRGEWLSLGASIYEERDRGRVAHEEVGLDAACSPTRWLDVASTLAYDLLTPGIVEAHAAVTALIATARLEAFATSRSPGRLLPATSIFSALGDIPSDRAGLALMLRLAPRLDVDLSAASLWIADRTGTEGEARVTLRLDDRGEGALRAEAHRSSVPDGGWSGLRAAARLALVRRLTLSLEAELVWPDEPQGRGRVWPWILGAVRYALSKHWEAAVALEANASPEDRAELDALARLSYRWEAR